MNRFLFRSGLVLIIILILISSGCVSKDKKETTAPLDSDGDGIPDHEDLNPFQADWGLNLTYLDDTSTNLGEWKVLISSSTDYGVLLVDNIGIESDTIDLEIISQPDGWTVTLEKSSVTLDNTPIEPVIITYNLGSSASGEQTIIVEGTSKNALIETKMNISLLAVVQSTNNQVTSKGDKCTVDYTLWLDDGSQIDSGTLPATAGERYVGPLENLGYITGFYMGLIGMEKPGGVLGLLETGETKRIRVPPELGYGTDPVAHELGGEVLIFEIVLRSST